MMKFCPTIVLVLVDLALSMCPPQCRCLWRASKTTVECTHLALDRIPEEIDSATQVLNLTSNRYPELHERIFDLAGLNNLQKIFLQDCGVTRVHAETFAGLLNLVELDLSQNLLTEVPSLMFQNTAGLMSLSLRSNPISSLRRSTFSHLRQLSKLDLSECKIQSVATGAFDGLVNLERLFLHQNQLLRLEHPAQLPASLHGITLHDNPWHCDCHLKEFRTWLARSNTPRSIEPVCHTPERISGFRIGVLSPAELACLPSLSPTSMYLSVPDGKNVSMVCRVVGEPNSRVHWEFAGETVQSRGPRVRVLQRYEGKEGTRSELLIANTSLLDNGTYSCVANNKAGTVTANYSLHVSTVSASPRIMELKLEHFVAVAIAVIVILVLLVVVAALLLIRVCRSRLETRETVAVKSSVMPRSIQMGTSQMTVLPKSSNGTVRVTGGPPDLLTEVPKTVSLDLSGLSVETTLTPASDDSCKTAMSTIIQEYGTSNQPIIGKLKTNPRAMSKSRTLPCLSDPEGQYSVWPSCSNPSAKDYPPDFGLPRVAHKYPTQEPYGTANNYFSPDSSYPQFLPSYVADSPYLHTSGLPVVVPRQKPVLPDEHYPDTSSLPYYNQNRFAGVYPATSPSSYGPQLGSLAQSDPQYESIRTVYQPQVYTNEYDHQWRMIRSVVAQSSGGEAVLQPRSLADQLAWQPQGFGKSEDDPTAVMLPQPLDNNAKADHKLRPAKSCDGAVATSRPSESGLLNNQNVIFQSDTCEEIQEKIPSSHKQAPVAKLDESESELESFGVSEELENAFQHLDGKNNESFEDEGPEGTEI